MCAYTATVAAPRVAPTAPSARDRKMASESNWILICPLVAPSARPSPISWRRSSTEITMMVTTLV
jgi:hypothetical protein